MAPRKQVISTDDHVIIGDLLRDIEQRLSLVANVVGPAYGSRFCDKCSKTRNAVWRVRSTLGDRFFDQVGYSWSLHDSPYADKSDRIVVDERIAVRKMATDIINPIVEYVSPTERISNNRRCLGALQFREHLVIGAMLMQIREDITNLWVNRLQHVYGKTDNVCKRAAQVIKYLDGLRSDLDSKVFSEHSEVLSVEGVGLPDVYYCNGKPHYSGGVIREVLQAERLVSA